MPNLILFIAVLFLPHFLHAQNIPARFDNRTYTVLSSGNSAQLLNKAMSAGSISAAKTYLADKKVQKEAEAGGDLSLRYKAQALTELNYIANMDWDDSNFNSLNQMLISRIGRDKTLSSCGVGPEPEKYLEWLKAFFPKYPQKSYKSAEKAVRKWEVVFGTSAMRMGISWENYSIRDDNAELNRWMSDPQADNTVYIDTFSWLSFDLLLRNAIINKIILDDMTKDNSCKPYCGSRLLEYSSSVQKQYEKGVRVEKLERKAIASGVLSSAQANELSSRQKSLSDKAALLDKYFDGSSINASLEDKLYIDAERGARPDEMIPADKREIFEVMLSAAVSDELKKAEAGNKALSKGIKIKIGILQNSYSARGPSGEIIIDSGLISEYMKLKGYAAASVMTVKAQLSELAAYVAPLAVYETALAGIEAEAEKAGIHNNTRTQEDEITALGEQSLFIAEIQRKDASAKNRYRSIAGYSAYAHRCAEMTAAYRRGQERFEKTVRMENSALPSVSSAAANSYSWLVAEKSRRAALSAAQLEEESYNFIYAYDEAKSMPVNELQGSIRFIEQEGLEKMISQFRQMENYMDFHSRAADETRRNYRRMMLRTVLKKAVKGGKS